jgi:hypothetical protein
MRAGAASAPRNDVTRTDHTKIGIRLSGIPGARLVRIVAIMFSPDSPIEMPMSAKAMRYESMPSTF